MKNILTAKTGIFNGVTEAIVVARGVAFLVRVGSDDIAARAIVAYVQLGIAPSLIVVEGEAAADFGSLTPYKL